MIMLRRFEQRFKPNMEQKGGKSKEMVCSLQLHEHILGLLKTIVLYILTNYIPFIFTNTFSSFQCCKENEFSEC